MTSLATTPPPVPQDLPRPIASARTGSSASIIGADLVITGNLVSGGELKIAGTVEGDIQGANIIIEDTASITGTISGGEVTIHGKVAGSITANHLVLARSCRLEGDILHETLVIEQGAVFEGKSRRTATNATVNKITA